MSGPGQIINAAVTDFYRDGPRNEPGPAGQIIAALGWGGFWISEDVAPWSNQAVAIVQELSREIGKIDLLEWAGSNILRQRQVDEIKRIQARAAKITSKHKGETAMNLKTVKKIDDVKLTGVDLDWVREDGQCREVRLTDKAGFTLVIRSDGRYGSDSLRVFRLAPETEKEEVL